MIKSIINKEYLEQNKPKQNVTLIFSHDMAD